MLAVVIDLVLHAPQMQWLLVVVKVLLLVSQMVVVGLSSGGESLRWRRAEL